MNATISFGRVAVPAALLLVVSFVVASADVSPQPRTIDTQTSVMTVRVYKAGMLSAFAHDHEISAPIAAGKVDAAGRSVELRVNASALVVRDPKASEQDRDEIRKTMLGPQVLDAERNPRIEFRSTTVEENGPTSWQVHGSLTLHGETRPVTVEVTEKDGRYVGHALLKQTDFGIKPVRLGGGTIRVKDEVRIEFDIHLAQ